MPEPTKPTPTEEAQKMLDAALLEEPSPVVLLDTVPVDFTATELTILIEGLGLKVLSLVEAHASAQANGLSMLNPQPASPEALAALVNEAHEANALRLKLQAAAAPDEVPQDLLGGLWSHEVQHDLTGRPVFGTVIPADGSRPSAARLPQTLQGSKAKG